MVLLVGEKAKQREPKGLKDAGHKYLICSNCGTELADIWITDPRVKKTEYFRAHCDICDDYSFVAEITGSFHIGILEGVTDLIDFDVQEIDGKPVRVVYTKNVEKKK